MVHLLNGSKDETLHRKPVPHNHHAFILLLQDLNFIFD